MPRGIRDFAMHHETARHIIRLLPLLLAAALLATAREAWHFLPTFNHDIRGIEARPAKDKSFSETIPASTQKLLKPDSGLTEKQRKEIHWHPTSFPHQDFVRLMPERRVFGWYGCQFDVPEALAGMDVLVDLGIIDDSDETFLNGRLVGKTGKVPDGSAWQADRLYRVPAELLESERNYLAVHVWSLWGLGGIVGPPERKHGE